MNEPTHSDTAGTRQRFVVACLTGDGIGPEVMAEASRALAEVSTQHGFRIDEVHPPFGGEAVTRSGHPLPPATRQATLRANAVLVAGSSQPALESVKAELDVACSVVRTLLPGGGVLTAFSPLRDGLEDWTVERAFAAARARRGRIASVGVDEGWRARVECAAHEHSGVSVRHLLLAEAAVAARTEPEALDVVVAQRGAGDWLAEMLRTGSGTAPTATGALSPTGPGVFVPAHGAARDIAGQGVANPTEMLLAVELLLAEGLGRRAAAETLGGSIEAALAAPARTPDVAASGRVAVGTREFVDVVLGLLPSTRRDVEVPHPGLALGGTR